MQGDEARSSERENAQRHGFNSESERRSRRVADTNNGQNPTERTHSTQGPIINGYKKPIITGAGNPTGEDIPNGAQTATQSDMGAELGESPGHASEVLEAFN